MIPVHILLILNSYTQLALQFTSPLAAGKMLRIIAPFHCWKDKAPILMVTMHLDLMQSKNVTEQLMTKVLQYLLYKTEECVQVRLMENQGTKCMGHPQIVPVMGKEANWPIRCTKLKVL